MDAPAHMVEREVECACGHVCVPGGRREVLAASLGTYKPCGRICLRCQLKAFSNVHPTPSPGRGSERAQEPNPVRTTPLPGLGAQLELHHPLSWPSRSPGGPKPEEGGAAASAPPTPCPFQAPFYNCHGTATKWGSSACAWPRGTRALHTARFSCYHPSGSSRGGLAFPRPKGAGRLGLAALLQAS